MRCPGGPEEERIIRAGARELPFFPARAPAVAEASGVWDQGPAQAARNGPGLQEVPTQPASAPVVQEAGEAVGFHASETE